MVNIYFVDTDVKKACFIYLFIYHDHCKHKCTFTDQEIKDGL